MDPLTPTEQQLVATWSRLLGVKSPGVRESFFQLGGDSMLAVMLVNAVFKEFGVRISTIDFTDHPTIAEMAAAIDQHRSALNDLENLSEEEAARLWRSQ